MGKWTDQLTDKQRAAITELGFDWEADCEQRARALEVDYVRLRAGRALSRATALDVETQDAIITQVEAGIDQAIAAMEQL